MSDYQTVLQKLSNWAFLSPNKDAWSFLDDKGYVVDSYSYYQLEKATTALAISLLEKSKLKAGDRVLLVFFPGLDFTATLLSCFKAGLVAVPVFPPDPRRLKKDLHHFISIQSDSGAKTVLTHGAYNLSKKLSALKNVFSNSTTSWPEMNWIQVDDILSKSKSQSKANAPTGVGPSTTNNGPIYHKSDYFKDVAFLQYTSGSTSEPKGVIITHESLAHNLSLIITELKADEDTVNVSWLPQYHDMGLIGSYLGVIHCGGRGFYLSPISFLKDPTTWVVAMSRFKGTHTQAPNFAYALVVRKYLENRQKNPELLELDLSHLQHMINAAEPVDYFAIQRFFEMFIPHGLPSSVVMPTYGLAEHTVFVCSGGNQVISILKASLESGIIQVQDIKRLSEISDDIRGVTSGVVPASFTAADSQVVVGCGYPGRGERVEVKIVDLESQQLVDDLKVGEIWVTSPSKSIGYWGHSAEDNDADFHAKISQAAAAANNHDGFLRTGDLGFMFNGELFVCGRSKDLIIIRGSNHYPQDIERTAELCHQSLRPGCSAAFAVRREQDDTEIIVFVAELKEKIPDSDYQLICDKIKLTIATEHGVSVAFILLLETRSIPKTTSGKIARSWCKRAYLANTLSVLYKWEGSASTAEYDVDVLHHMQAIEATNATGTAGNMEQQQQILDAEVEEGGGSSGKLSEEVIRSMSVAQIIVRLETTLVKVASTSPSQMSAPIDRNAALISLGLDSMTLVQFKGVLENRFYSNIPDEFLFTNICTLSSLAEAVKLGELTKEQKAMLEAKDVANPDEQQHAVVVVEDSAPCCPWFYWCR